MRVLHNYITRQILQTLLMTVMVFTGVLLLGNVLKDVLEMMMNRQATFGFLMEAIGLLIPYVVAFSLPIGLLAATLLTLGRLSADQELTAVRANGISLIALITPVLLLSVAMCVLSAWINMQVAPQCRVAFKNLKDRLATEQPLALLMEDRYVDSFPGYTIFVKKKRGNDISDVLIYQLNTNNIVESRIRAASGKVRVDLPAKQMILDLTDGQILRLRDGQWEPTLFGGWNLSIGMKPNDQADADTRISEMTFDQLVAKRRALEKQGVDTTPVKVQLHRQIACSFACIGFAMVGIPLGIRAHRRETTFGIAVAVVLVLVYYSFVILGQSLETKPQYLPHLLVWVPNFVFQGVGAILLLRANRGA